MEIHEYKEPSLPLSPEQFRHALNAGLGRARIHLDKYGLSSELRQVVLASALKCQFYDPQVDGLPADWFAEFCDTADLTSQVLAEKRGTGHWDQAWRFALLAAFTRRDYPGARAALYDALIETDEGDLLGAEDLIEVEGASGLLYVARRLGATWRDKTPTAPDDGPLLEFDDAHTEGAAIALLTTAAKDDEDIATYLRTLTSRPSPSPTPPRTRPTPEETIALISSATTSRPGLTYRVKGFTTADIEPIRRLAGSTLDEIVLENCLRALAGCESLPFDDDLVPFLKHPTAAVRHYAALIIGRHSNEVVAALGRRLLATDLAVGLSLLRTNALPSDLELILASLKTPQELDDVHDVASAVLDVLDDSSLPQDPRLALHVYEATPCHVCRLLAVKTLLTSETCPSWLLDEASFDASYDIRELVTRASLTT